MSGKPEWYRDAACLGLTDQFYPEARIGRSARCDDRVGKAKLICATCPCTHACLLFAYDNCEVDGVWGGVFWGNSKERRRARALIKAWVNKGKVPSHGISEAVEE